VTDGPIYNSGHAYYYEVNGAPRELGYTIARHHGGWRVGRIVNSLFGWSGEFETPEAALAELQAEVDAESRQR
jgi:hypothetical protein